MADKQGFYYYTKEEINELFAPKIDMEDFTFTFTRTASGSETLTGKRFKIANDLYIYTFSGKSSIGTTSTGNKEYNITWNKPFDVIYGASLNAAFTGQSNSTLNHVDFRKNVVDFYINSTATTGNPIINFIVIGKPQQEESE